MCWYTTQTYMGATKMARWVEKALDGKLEDLSSIPEIQTQWKLRTIPSNCLLTCVVCNYSYKFTRNK